METNCPYLNEVVCKASVTNMTPSLFETTVYCTTEEHYRCPILLARTLRDGHAEGLYRANAFLSR